MKERIFALIDCNNFFVSCERIFRPDLANKPVAVLSNNDGCIVARSQEVKDLGVKMGVPLFQVKDIVSKNNIKLFSANFQLYADISKRIMQILSSFAPQIEIYSIDEAFLDITDLRIADYKKFGKDIIKRIKKEIGVPVSVGIAPTKTLCKVANEFAKHERKFNAETIIGIKDKNSLEIDKVLEQLAIGDIWGIGWKNNEKMKKCSIYSALDLKNADRIKIRKIFSVQTERTLLELNSISCFHLEIHDAKKMIASTRSFGKPVTDKHELEEAVASYTSKAAMKLRRQDSVAKEITVYIRNNKHSINDNKVFKIITKKIPIPTNFTPELVKYAIECLDIMFEKGIKYYKAGVILSHINNAHDVQLNLIEENNLAFMDKKTQLMTNIDKINKKYGHDVIKSAIIGFEHKWKVKTENISKRYTTNWNEILKVDI